MSRTGPTGGTLLATPLYRNPFRKASVTAGRIDQGVDYAGRPGDPIYALGNGKVIETFPFGGSSGWPGGGWISYELTDGPAKGQIVYIAEDVQPVVTAGQRVTPNTVIAHFGPGGGIETGFAGPLSQGDNTLAYSQRQSDFGGSDIGGWTTLAGAEFSNLIASTGGPAGIPQAGGVHGPGGALVPGFKFGKGGPSSGPGAGSGGGTLPADCLIGLPSAKAFIIAGPTIGGGCIITRSEARALVGAGLMLIGGGLLLIGTLILAAYGLKGSGAGQKAATAAQAVGGAVALVPGGEPAGAVIAATATAAKQRGSSARAKAATGVVRKQRARESRAVAADQRKKKAAAAKQQQQIRTASRPAAAKKGP